jgi:hypothetical protein
MADNFQQFSEIVPALTAKEQAWARRVLGEIRSAKQLTAAGINPKVTDLDDWPGFHWEVDPDNGDLWLCGQDHGNVSHAAEFVRAMLARFRPTDCWSLTWSETCSRPRVGEFGGGGVFVTSRSVRAFGALNWVQRQRKAFQKSPARHR